MPPDDLTSPRSLRALRGQPVLGRRAFLLGAAALALGACGNGGNGDAASSGGGSTTTGLGAPTDGTSGPDEVEVTDTLGTRLVPRAPQGVVCLDGRSDLELAVLCGFPVLAYYDRSTPTTPYPPALSAAVADAVKLDFEANFEQLADLDPDLILDASTYRLDTLGRDLFEAIAPVLITARTAQSTQADWKDEFLYFAEVFDRGAAATDLLADYEEAIAAIARESGPAIAATELALVQSLGPGDATVVLHPPANLLIGAVVSDVGGTFAAFQTELTEAQQVAAEQLGIISGDHIVRSSYDLTPGTFDELEANPLWSQLPAVRAGAVTDTSVLVVNFGGPYGALACADLVADVYRAVSDRGTGA